jgi:hypothetical protein
MANQNHESESINDKLSTKDMAFDVSVSSVYDENYYTSNTVERHNNRTLRYLKVGLGLTIIAALYMWTAADKKAKEYKLMPEIKLIDQLFGYQVNALDKKSPTFDEAKDALKEEHEFKVNSVRETYKYNGIIN